MADPAKADVQNLLPVQAYFNLDGSFNTFIGQGQPFYATVYPYQSGLVITDSTIDSTIIGGNVPSTGTFTNITTTTGTISTGPVNAADIANKQYVDQIAAGLSVKAPVLYGTTGNITLSGLGTQSGGEWTGTLPNQARILVKNQATQADNGIYVASAGAWARASDMSTWAQVPGAFCFIEQGATLADTGYVCTSDPGGTIGVTAITWVQFTGLTTYSAGTGLNLVANTFNIVNTGVTAASYGSASSVATFTVNAQGQLTTAGSSSIAINANQITSGTIASSLISGSYTGITGLGTLLDLTVTNSIVGSITGNAATATTASSATTSTNLTGGSTGAIPYQTGSGATTFLASGTGVLVGGSAPSYTTTPSLVGTNFTGTASGLSIGGNAATATTATNIAGGSANAFPYQNAAGSTVFLSAGTAGNLLQTNGSGSAPTFVAPSGITTGFATNISGGVAGAVPYQSAVGTTGFSAAGTSNQVLLSGGTGSPTWANQSSLSVGYANNLNGGSAGTLAYQTGSNTTGFLAVGTNGYVLTLAGGLPTWAALPATGVTIADDTTTNATRYLTFTSATTGNITTENVSSTKLQFNPSTGVLTSTSFTGAGTGLTGTASSLSIGGNAATVTNGVYTTGSYSNPSWITSILGSIVSGAVASATSATTATNLAAGAAGSIPYQTASGTTAMLAAGTNGYVLTLAAGVPTWAASTGGVTSFQTSFSGLTPSTSTTGAITLAGTLGATSGGTSFSTYATGDLIYASATNTLSKLAAGTNGYVLTLAGGVPTWAASGGGGGGVTSITGTTNQITASASTGAVTLSLPSTVTTGGYIANQSVASTSNAGAFSYGSLNGSDVNLMASFQANVNNYAFIGLQNTNSGSAASTDITLYNSTASLGAYIDMGITSSGYTGSGGLYKPNMGYVYTNSTDITFGTLASNAIHFVVNNGSADAMTISATGNVSTPNLLTGAEVVASNGIFVNSKTVAASYSIPSGSAAMSTGPITIASGQSVTIPSGSKWVVL